MPKLRIKSEHPAKIVPPNSHGHYWIRITYIFINGLLTISAQIIDSKQPRKKFLRSVIADYITPDRAGTVLVMEPELHLNRAHKGIGPMRPSKGVAGVEHVALIGDVGAAEAYHPVLSKRLSDGQVKGVVAGQMIGTITVQKTRAIVESDRGEAPPRQVPIEAG